MKGLMLLGLFFAGVVHPSTPMHQRAIAPQIATASDTQVANVNNAINHSADDSTDDSTGDSTDYADVVITLERTPCFGSCPVYRLTIYGDGTVVYEGLNFVAEKGKRTTRLNPEQVAQLVNAFDQANFFALQDEYTIEVTDLPGVIISMQRDGESKRIWHYGSGFYPEDSAPPELRELENQIDEIVNSQQWIEG